MASKKMSVQLSKCLWCTLRSSEEEPGAHHAADCPKYRSPFVGPEAGMWATKLRETTGRVGAEALLVEILLESVRKG